MAYTVKQISDVHWKVILRRLSTIGNRPFLAIGTPSKDDKVHFYTYDNIFDLGNRYDESTELYKIANNAWDVDDFQGKEIEIIEYPTGTVTVQPPISLDAIKSAANSTTGSSSNTNSNAAQVNSNGDVTLGSSANSTSSSASGTSNSAASANTQGTVRPGVAYAFANHLYDGYRFATLADANGIQDYLDLSDMFYDNQRTALVAQVDNLQDMFKAYEHVQSYQTDDSKLGNFSVLYEPKKQKFPVGSALGYAAANLPVDFKHIGNLDDFDVPDGLTQEELDVINQMNGWTIEQTANDLMISSGKALTGDYLDQFVNTQYVVDKFQFCLQRFLNHKQFGYTQGILDLMKKALEETDGQLQASLFLYQPSEILDQKRKDVSNTDVNEREYNGFKIKCQINDDIETINGIIDLTV